MKAPEVLPYTYISYPVGLYRAPYSRVYYGGRFCILTSIETVIGPRMIRKSSSLELVVQHSMFSSRRRAATQGRTHSAGNPAAHKYL